MSERTPSHLSSTLTTDELLPCQQHVRDLTGQLLKGSSFTTGEWAVETDAEELRQRLMASPLGDLLLAEDTELTPNPEYYTGKDKPSLQPGHDAELVGVSVGVWGTSSPMRRFLPLSRQEEFAGREDVEVVTTGERMLVDFPGQYSWRGSASLCFWYQGRQLRNLRLGERIVVDDDHNFPGKLPYFSSQAIVQGPQPADAFTGYLQMERQAHDEAEVDGFLAIVQALHTVAVRD